MYIWRLLISALIGATFSVLYPLMDRYTALIKVVLSCLMVLVIKKDYTLKNYLITLTVFYIVSFVFAGASLMLSEIFSVDNSLLPFTISLAVLLSCMGINYLTNYIFKEKNKKEFHFKVEIIDKQGSSIWTSYYDSGNKLYDRENQPIIIISQKIFEQLHLQKCGEIAVNTVGGIKMLKLVNLRYKIYYSDKLNKLYQTHAAVSENFSAKEYDIILHRDMGGINE